jgi:hypothetical protein
VSSTALRFRPPRVPVSPDVRWMLLRAFGPPGTPFSGPLEPAAALATARRFEVSARIAARLGRERLAAELGPDVAAGFRRDRVAAVAVEVRLEEVARDLAATAAPLGIPLVFVKFLGLYLAGVLLAGSRPACDLDVLVPAADAPRLQRALAAAGYQEADVPEKEHQLAPLRHPGGGILELHGLLPGVRLGPGRASATAEALADRGLLVPLSGWPGRCSLPVPAVLAAHALVHGIAQHGHFPDAYSQLKMVGDLADLGLAGEPGEDLATRLAPWVARDLDPGEIAAARGLCAGLAAGREPAPESPAGLLLRHILAGRLDPGYLRALKLGMFREHPSDEPALLRLGRALLRAVVLTRGQIDAIYGRPASGWGYLGRRLARPFDLAWRLGRALASTRRLAAGAPAPEKAAGGPVV